MLVVVECGTTADWARRGDWGISAAVVSAKARPGATSGEGGGKDEAGVEHACVASAGAMRWMASASAMPTLQRRRKIPDSSSGNGGNGALPGQ